MEKQNTVCSRDQAEKLKELGIAQESVFYWCHFIADDFSGWWLAQRCDKGFYHDISGMVETFDVPAGRWYSAFTDSELGAMLPESIPTNSNVRSADLVIRKSCGEWEVAYDVDEATEGGYGPDVKVIYSNIASSHVVSAVAKADMVIYLIAQRGIDVAEFNERLSEK